MESESDPLHRAIESEGETIDFDTSASCQSNDSLVHRETPSKPDDGTARNYVQLNEPPSERRRRYWSLTVITMTAFTFNLSFSIILTSAKPYLDEMDRKAGTSFLGFFIAAQPLAQLFFSPLMGALGNKFGSVRILTMMCTLLLAGGFSLYACVSTLPEPRRWYLFAARFVIGAAAGAITLCFSYVASATTMKERTTAVSLYQMAQSTAFVLGPVIQSAFAPLGTGRHLPFGNDLYINIFTGPSWLSVLLAFVNLFLLVPCIFTEYNTAKKEGDFLSHRASVKNDAAHPEANKKPDKPALIICIIAFSSIQFNFVFLESLATLLVMEQLGWAETQAIVTVGLAFAGAGIYVAIIFASLGPVARKIGERTILVMGIVFLIMSPIALYPYAGPPPPFKHRLTNDTLLNQVVRPVEFASPLHRFFNLIKEGPIQEFSSGGCPIDDQPWCGYTPAVHPIQLLLGFVFIATGFPMGLAMSNSIFSKILGPYPQGTWMGILAGGSCVARILCPIAVTTIYSAYGTWATFGFMTIVMTIVLILFLTYYRRLVPYCYADTSTSTSRG